MTALRVAVVFIERADTYFLQLRSADPGKGAAGLIGAFGGKVEHGETPIAAANRELQEETTLTVDASRLKRLGEVMVSSDYQLKAVTVRITAFSLQLGANEAVVAREGDIIELTKEAALKRASELTTGTRACFELLMKER